MKAVTSNGVPAASCSENDNKQGQSQRDGSVTRGRRARQQQGQHVCLSAPTVDRVSEEGGRVDVEGDVLWLGIPTLLGLENPPSTTKAPHHSSQIPRKQ